MRRGPGRARSPRRCPLPGAPRPLPRGAAEHKAPPPGTPREPPPPAPSLPARRRLFHRRCRSPSWAWAASGAPALPRPLPHVRLCSGAAKSPPQPRRATAQTFPDGPSPAGREGRNPRPLPPPAPGSCHCAARAALPARGLGRRRPLPTLAQRAAPGPERGGGRWGGREGGGGTHCSSERRARFFKSPSFRPLPPRVRAREAPPPPRPLPCALIPLPPAAHPHPLPPPRPLTAARQHPPRRYRCLRTALRRQRPTPSRTHTPRCLPGLVPRAGRPPAPHNRFPVSDTRAATTLTSQRRPPPPSSLLPRPPAPCAAERSRPEGAAPLPGGADGGGRGEGKWREGRSRRQQRPGSGTMWVNEGRRLPPQRKYPQAPLRPH